MVPVGEVQEIKEETFDASGTHCVKDLRQGIVLCLGGLLALIRGAKAEEMCGAGQCQVQLKKETEIDDSSTDWMMVTMILMTTCVLIGVAFGWMLRSWWGVPKGKGRNVRTQSQTCYRGRFVPLHDRDQGAWMDFQSEEVQSREVLRERRFIPMKELMQGRRDL